MQRRHRISRTSLALLLLASILAVALSGCSQATNAEADKPAARTELRVSAASSLKKLLEATAPEFEKANGTRLVFNFGASGLLQKQIEGGAPCDVFVSASPTQMNTLIAAGLISAQATSTFASNDLVVLVPKGNPAGIHGPDDFVKATRIVTGNPETAPHGTKAKEWLTGLGMWDSLQPRFVFAENAAQTLDYVVRGEVDAGIGFGSEAQGTDAVEVAYTVPTGAITPVRYVAAPLLKAEQAGLAAAYVEYLNAPTVQKALIKAGFLPAPAK